MARGGRGRGWPKRGPWSRLKPSLAGVDASPVGTAPVTDYRWGTHAQATYNAEGLKSVVFRSAVAAVVTAAAVPALVFAPPQAYAEPNRSFISAPVVGSTPQPIKQLAAAPQLVDLSLQPTIFDPLTGPQGPTVRPFTSGPLQVDLTQQGAIFRPTPARQGAVPALEQSAPQQADLTLQPALFQPLPQRQGGVPALFVGAPQADPSQLAPRLTPPQPAAPITPNPVASFFVVPPQLEERPARIVWPAQRAGSTPTLPPLVLGAPQQDPSQTPPLLVASRPAAVIVPNPIAGFFAVPPQVEERPSRTVWQPQRAGAQPQAAPTVVVPPQVYDFNLKAVLTPSAIGAPGPVRQIYATQQFYDYQQKTLITPSAIGGPLPIRQLYASQQFYDYQQKTLVTPAAVAPPPAPPALPIRSLYAAPQLAWLQAPSQLYLPAQSLFFWSAPLFILDQGETARVAEGEAALLLDQGERSTMNDQGETSRILDQGETSRTEEA